MDEELEKRVIEFKGLNSRLSVARFFGLSLQTFAYVVYHLPEENHYKKFVVKKRNGKEREIQAPHGLIKQMQQQLNVVLQQIYHVKKSVHGFVPTKSIVTNATPHCRQRYVINFDLENFFPSINYGRVYGLFLSKPFLFDKEVASALAKICCYKGFLPQGAPTSPTISNFICHKLDNQLLGLSLSKRCVYTRYADDITISTNLKLVPREIVIENTELNLSDEIQEIIKTNGFSINAEKTRLQTRGERQSVTGLTTNKFPNVQRKFIRKLRAQIRAWEKFGYEKASFEYFTKYDKKNRMPEKMPPNFYEVVKGNLSFLIMVRGKNDPIYKKLVSRLSKLMPEVFFDPETNRSRPAASKILLHCEGKTDYSHIQAALIYFHSVGMYLDINFDFGVIDFGGSPKLFNLLENTTHVAVSEKTFLFLFDRDEPDFLKKVSTEKQDFKNWGKRVFSMALPIPKFREQQDGISIEFLYKDKDLKREDENGRRIFTNDEFNPKTGLNIQNKDLFCPLSSKLSSKYIKIVDYDVFDRSEKNVALSKNNFADSVLNKPSFRNMDFDGFVPLFETIKLIQIEAQR